MLNCGRDIQCETLNRPNRLPWLVGDQELTLAVKTLSTEQNQVPDSRVKEPKNPGAASREPSTSFTPDTQTSVPRNKNSLTTACNDQNSLEIA